MFLVPPFNGSSSHKQRLALRIRTHIMSISAIIPCFNEERYIEDAILALLEQEVPDLEIIVVDDGSTDATEDIVKSLDGPIVYCANSGKGVSSARNTGASIAKYPFLFFIDADDRPLPGALNLFLKRMQYHGERCSLVTAEMTYRRAEPTFIEEKEVSETVISTRDFVFRNQICSAVLLRKNAFESVGGFDPKMTHSEDHDLWIRLSVHWEIIRIDKVLLQFTDRPESASKSPERMFQGGLYFLSKCKSSPELSNIPFWVYHQRRSVLHLQCSYNYSNGGNNRKALFEMLKSLFFAPVLCSSARPKNATPRISAETHITSPQEISRLISYD